MRNKIAVIDCGTNTFNLIIASGKKDDFEVHYEDELSVRAGKNGISHGVITESALKRCLEVLKKYVQKIAEYNVYHKNVYVLATSAFRNAKNADQIQDRIKNETGLVIQFIDGNQEADLIYYGVKHAIKIEDNVLIVDIGGGSVEFIIANSQEVLWKKSFEIGAQRLIDAFYKSDPMSDREILSLQDYIAKKLLELHGAIDSYKPETIIGASGTFETLSDIYISSDQTEVTQRKPELPFDIKAFKSIYTEIIQKSTNDRSSIPGMSSIRVDMISVALEIVNHVVFYHKFQALRITSYALKEGAIFQLLNNQV